MAHEREARPAEQAGDQQADSRPAGSTRDGSKHPGNEPPQEPNVNQVRDEPFRTSHYDAGRPEDDGRPEPEDESSAPNSRGGQG
jgi:hypothetical protein